MIRPALTAILAAWSLASGLIAQTSEIPAGPWNKAKTPDGWMILRTKNYEVQSQCGKDKAQRLGDHMETMNKVYRRMFPPGKDGAKQQVIKLFKDREAYLKYGAPPSSAAYFSRSDREMVCYDTGKWSDESEGDGPITGGGESALERRMRRVDDLWKMDLLGCAAHEGWHQYFSWYVVSMVVLPSWINEGMGDYFYTAAPKEVRGRKIPAELGRMNDGRLMVLKAAIRQNRYVPIPELLGLSKEDFYANGSVCYAEGWALCQFLLHSGNKRYEKVIPNYVRYVKDNSNFDQVQERAFKGVDLQELDKDFRAWVDSLPDPEEEAMKDEPESPTPAGSGEPPSGGEPTGGGQGGGGE